MFSQKEYSFQSNSLKNVYVIIKASPKSFSQFMTFLFFKARKVIAVRGHCLNVVCATSALLKTVDSVKNDGARKGGPRWRLQKSKGSFQKTHKAEQRSRLSGMSKILNCEK